MRRLLLILTDNSRSRPASHSAARLCKQMRVVSDEACVPELRPELFQNITGDMSSSINSWIKQQLIKLACSLTVKVPPAHAAACAAAAGWDCKEVLQVNSVPT